MLQKKIYKNILAGCFATVFLIGLTVLTGPLVSTADSAEKDHTQRLETLGKAFRDVSKKISPAVVYISTVYTMESLPEQYQELFATVMEHSLFRPVFPMQHE